MSSPRIKTNILFEVGDIQVHEKLIVAAIKTAWIQNGKAAKDLTDLIIYVKAEDKKAYFIANGDIHGDVILSNADDLSSDVSFVNLPSD